MYLFSVKPAGLWSLTTTNEYRYYSSSLLKSKVESTVGLRTVTDALMLCRVSPNDRERLRGMAVCSAGERESKVQGEPVPAQRLVMVVVVPDRTAPRAAHSSLSRPARVNHIRDQAPGRESLQKLNRSSVKGGLISNRIVLQYPISVSISPSISPSSSQLLKSSHNTILSGTGSTFNIVKAS